MAHALLRLRRLMVVLAGLWLLFSAGACDNGPTVGGPHPEPPGDNDDILRNEGAGAQEPAGGQDNGERAGAGAQPGQAPMGGAQGGTMAAPAPGNAIDGLADDDAGVEP